MKKYWIVIIVLGIIFVGVILLLGIPLGQKCGYWSAFGGPQKSCECVGIKTGHCPPFALCDSGSFGCIGICQNCVCRRMNQTTHNWEEVPCD